jgi:hypothetical protein
VIAIGLFSKSVDTALAYPAEYYANVKEGSKVITCVFEALTSEQSHKLAEAFGVGSMELGSHHLSAAKANLELLVELFDEENVREFELLVLHGFDFYYLPNAQSQGLVRSNRAEQALQADSVEFS